MSRNNDFINDAVFRLSEILNADINIKSNRNNYDVVITVNDLQFIVDAKADIRASNQGIILNEITQFKQITNKPIIVVAKYIALDIAEKFRLQGINYIDSVGNTYIKHKDFFVFVSGQKTQTISRTKQSRAFQEAGIKLIFSLLVNPNNLQRSYRELSEIADISIGSVSNIIKELEDLNFILKTNTKRVLKNTSELLKRWIVAYNDVLRPRITKKRMRFSNVENYNNWDTISIQNAEDLNLWGGEPAAAIITGQLQPERFTIYTTSNWQSIAKDLKLIPDENGDVEILYVFWKEEETYREWYITPALLVYADLISSGHERNIQIAKEILENDLQYIK